MSTGTGVPTVPADASAVERSYETCRRMQLRHDPTYYWATRCLPADRRRAVHALYGFVRGADDIADGAAGPDGRRAALDAWQGELERGLEQGGSAHPVIAALVDAGPRFGLPLEHMPRYMDAMRSDCRIPVRMRTQEELDLYMGGTATVGLMVAPLLDASPSGAAQLERLGVAFQLTNLIRDVREDWRMGRVYLPGLHELDLSRGAATHRLREHVAGQVDRARALFREVDVAALALPIAFRPGVRVARAVYLRVLDRVERQGYDVITRTGSLRPWEATGAVVGALLP